MLINCCIMADDRFKNGTYTLFMWWNKYQMDLAYIKELIWNKRKEKKKERKKKNQVDSGLYLKWALKVNISYMENIMSHLSGHVL